MIKGEKVGKDRQGLSKVDTHHWNGIFGSPWATNLFCCTVVLDIFKSIYRTEGLRGYYQGFMATLLAFTPSSVTHWAGYEATKKVLFNHLYAREQKQIQQGKHDGFFATYRLSQNNMFIVG